jgi:hypothetical protein
MEPSGQLHIPAAGEEPLDRSLSGLQSQSGWFGEVKILDPTVYSPFPSVMETVAICYTDYATVYLKQSEYWN